MGAIVKILIGALMMIISVWWAFQGSGQYLGRSYLNDLITLLNAGIPIVVFVIGLFILWLELDELRIEKELKTEKKKK
jgi:uncharacterized membrane protein YwzB